VKSIFSAAGVPVTWDEQVVGKEVDPRTNSFVTRDNLDSVLVRVFWLCLMNNVY
jgi:isocitrate dehydrogenase (NAD+)